MKKQFFSISALFAFVAVLATGISSSAFAYTFDRDVPQAVQTQVRTDMEFIRGIQGNTASGLHGQIWGTRVDGPTYVKWFEDRVKAVGMNSCGDAKAVACVIPFMSNTKIWFTQNYVKFSHPQVAKMMIVFHEARHTEKNHGNWGHATCPTPFVDSNGTEVKSIWTGATLAGEPACDVTPFGSYGSSMIMLKNIQKFCTNCTDKVRMDAGLYADDQFKRLIDANAIAQVKKDLY
jgi:hypothetical protein